MFSTRASCPPVLHSVLALALICSLASAVIQSGTYKPLGPSNQPEAYFNGTSYIHLSRSLSLQALSGLSFRSCVGGELFRQRFGGLLLQVTAVYDQIAATIVSSQRWTRTFAVNLRPLDNRWHFVSLNYDVTGRSPQLLLQVDGRYTTVIANTSYNADLLSPLPSTPENSEELLIGNQFSGCIREGPQLEFVNFRKVLNVQFGPCPLSTQECTDKKDVLSSLPKDHCEIEPCMRHGTCISLVDKYECHCTARYSGKNCEIDNGPPCASQPCLNGGTCVEDKRGDFSCQCGSEYHGVNCEQKVSVDPLCTAGACKNGGSCDVLSGTEEVVCTCLPGFTGSRCETDIDECAVTGKGICLNGGKCIDSANNYTCDCTDTGYTGVRCEENINECREEGICKNGVCYDLYGSYVCACLSGYVGEDCGMEINSCADGTCVCEAGWTGPRCDRALTCAVLNCPALSYCVEPSATTKYAQCVCSPGFFGAPGISPNCTKLAYVCQTAPCHNGGTCMLQTDNFTCICSSGYTGVYCDQQTATGKAISDSPIERCDDQPCAHAVSCKDYATGFRCECTAGWSGPRCDTPNCTRDYCFNGGTCFVTKAGPGCTCLPEYAGKQCERETSTTSLPEACSPNPCMNNASCRTVGSKLTDYKCVCKAGFEGTLCERAIDCRSLGCPNKMVCNETPQGYVCQPAGTISCPANIPCINGTCQGTEDNIKCVCIPGFTGEQCSEDINECSLTPNLCNHGVCINNAGSYECFCKPGYTGDSCSIDVDECLPKPCKNNGTCQNLENNYACICMVGFKGKDCSVNINECESNPCADGSTCVDGIGTFSCVCREGLTGPTCETDIDDCESQPCQHGGKCRDALNGYSCDCAGTGFTGVDCSVNIDECSPNPCKNNATCVDKLNDYKCDCFVGYTGKNCEQDMSECDPNPCQYDGICLERSNLSLYRPGFDPETTPVLMGNYSTMLLPNFFYNNFSYENASGFECVCVPGIEGAHCDVNVNECASNPCGAWGKCVDGVNSFKCECEPGFEGADCKIDIDECERYHPCVQGVCHDKRATYECFCKEGWGGINCSVSLTGCLDKPCADRGTCHPWLYREKEHKFNCSCFTGYHGTTCKEITTMSFENHGYAEVNTTRDEGYDIQFRFKTTLANGLLAVGRGITFYILELSNGRLNLHSSLLNKWEGVFIGSNLNDSNWQKVFVTINSSHVVLAANEEQTIYPINQNEATNASSTSFSTTWLGGTIPNYAKLSHGPSYFVGCFQDVTVNSEWVLPEQPATLEVATEPSVGAARVRLSGVTASCQRTPQCTPNPCQSGGSCEDRWTSFRCTCPRPYLGRTCQYNYTAATFSHENATSRAVVSVIVTEAARKAVRSALDISMFIRTRQPSGDIFHLGSKAKNGVSDETSVGASLVNGELLIHLRFNQTPEDYTVGGTRLDNGHVHLIQVVRNSTLVQVKLNGTEYFRKSISAAKQLDAQVLYLGGPPPTEPSPTAPPPKPEQYYKGVIQDVQVSNGTHAMVVEFFPLDVPGVPAAFGEVSLDPNAVLPGVVSDDACAASPCEHNGTCTVTWNDFTCSCTRGYKGKSCHEVEFCQLQECPRNSLCRNLDGGYECLANATFDGMNSTLIYKLELNNETFTKMLSYLDTVMITYRSKTGGTLLHAEYVSGVGVNYLSIGVYRDQVTVLWQLDDSLPVQRRFRKEPPDYEWSTIHLVVKDNLIKGGFYEWQKEDSPAFSEALDTSAWLDFITNATIHLGGVSPFFSNTSSVIFDQNITVLPHKLQSMGTSGIYSMDLSSTPPSMTDMMDEGAIFDLASSDNVLIDSSQGEYFKGCMGAVHVGPLLLPYFSRAQLGSAAAASFSLLPEENGTSPSLGCKLCLPNDCRNNGVCRGDDAYECVCTAGFEGDNCGIDINECEKNDCQHGALCKDGIGNYTCECSKGWEGWLCNLDVEECASSPCLHGGICTENTPGLGFLCACGSGWTGQRCDRPRATSCRQRPCGHGQCLDAPSDAQGNNFTCVCDPGFVGLLCDTAFCVAQPCLNNGTCLTEDIEPSCQCDVGWRGIRCETEINECEEGAGMGACLHGGRCLPSHAAFACDCTKTGYRGLNCESDVDECAEGIVDCGPGSCFNLNGSYTCNCTEGSCGDRCALPDPCIELGVISDANSTTGPCRNGGQCEQTCAQVVDYLCHCVDGWGGKNCTDKVAAAPEEGANSTNAVAIGIAAAVIGVAIIGGALAALMAQARAKRATRGTYSPSSQEYCNPRIEALSNALKPPPEERLI